MWPLTIGLMIFSFFAGAAIMDAYRAEKGPGSPVIFLLWLGYTLGGVTIYGMIQFWETIFKLTK